MSIPTELASAFDSFVTNHLSRRVQLMDASYGPTPQVTQEPAKTVEPVPSPQTFKNKAIPIPKEFQPYVKNVYKMYPDLPKGSVESTLMMESSMGTNKNNQPS